MNVSRNEPQPDSVDPVLLDRLVDGELDPQQRKSLLRRLDSDGNWRDCAMAFLEAQAWQEDLGGLAAQSAVESQPREATQPVAQSGNRSQRLLHLATTVTAMAASFLLALYLGMSMKTPGDVPGIADPGTTVIKQPAGTPVETIPVTQEMIPAKTSIPGELVQALRRMGYRVDKQRKMVPVPTENGREVMVPIEQVDVHYVGNPYH